MDVNSLEVWEVVNVNTDFYLRKTSPVCHVTEHTPVGIQEAPISGWYVSKRLILIMMRMNRKGNSPSSFSTDSSASSMSRHSTKPAMSLSLTAYKHYEYNQIIIR